MLRRRILQLLGSAAVVGLFDRQRIDAADQELRVAGKVADISVTPISPYSVRIQLIEHGNPAAANAIEDGALAPPARRETDFQGLQVSISRDPLTVRISTPGGRNVQLLKIDESSGAVTFGLGGAPVLGLGEGGPQFDRRGDLDSMPNGQGGYRLPTHGARVPIQWLVGTAGWAVYIHCPLGSFDLTGEEGVFHPASVGSALPLDIFVVDAADPARAMTEYARITGYPEMPPLWALGYQQSHRTLGSRDEVLSIARIFRERKLPCDVLIYLGTGFTPSGWNTANGSFQFNPSIFPDPEEMIRQFHQEHFRVVLHSVILTRTLRGTVHDPCPVERFDPEETACLWDAHRKDFALGVDGWWPDEGDALDAASRLRRIRMYYEGPQLDRPGQRPYALHRNGYAGMQRYAPFLWSGDVYSTWETLHTQVPIAINSGLCGMPLWGTDTGGFVPTKELTGELFLRWFQFSAFCPLFRSHGRDWKLHLPWGWNTGELGPAELGSYKVGAANPDPSEFHNADVEPICRKYLELRYRLMPYLYSAVRESHETGLPIMRALWLHYPDDPTAVALGDQYLWGRDILVTPVTEKGATTRRAYLPRGNWFDFWTEARHDGGREVARDVDLATMPLYVRAGSILPFAPLRQYTSEPVDGPLSLVVYPGADATYELYEDDGFSFNYRRGEWMKLAVNWDDDARRLTVKLASGSRMLAPLHRNIEVRVAPEKETKRIEFSGRPVEIQL
jgi:alpha-glucosidase (family GH31 glycosyl hydrolase)